MNKAEKSLRWVVNQIPDFTPKNNEEKMLVAIKLYSEAGAEEIKRLEAENAALRERLDKAVILPCKIGDTIYEAAYSGCIQEWIVTDISYKNYGQDYEFRMNCESKNDSKSCRPFIKRTHWNDFEGIGRARFTRAAAEKRLAELGGEK